MIEIVRILLPAILSAATLSADVLPSMTLAPTSGIIYGSPGATAGWGFSIKGDELYFLAVTSVQPDITPSGSFAEYFSIYSQVLEPGQTWNVAFDPTLEAGLGAFSIDPAATPGALDVGTFLVTWDLYNGNPFAGGEYERSGDFRLPYAISITPPAEVVVPEPSAWVLTVTILLGAGICRRRR